MRTTAGVIVVRLSSRACSARAQVRASAISLWVMLAALLAACTPEALETPTQVTVRISADSALLADATELRVRASLRLGEDQWRAPAVNTYDSVGLQWPVEVPVYPRSSDESAAQFEFVAEVLQDKRVIGEARVISAFRPREHVMLNLGMFTCVDAEPVCSPGCNGTACKTCSEFGVCELVRFVDPGSLPPAAIPKPGESGSDAGSDESSEDSGLNVSEELRDGGMDGATAPECVAPAACSMQPVDAGSQAVDASAPRDGSVAQDTGSPQPDAGRAPTCATMQCSANSTCVESGGPRCQCNQGYRADASGGCANIDDCSSNPCGAPNTCVDGLNDYSCTCATNYLRVSVKRCVAPFATIEARRHTTSAMRSDGTGAWWGHGAGPTAGPLSPLVNVQQITTGESFGCALLMGGTVSCWGSNYFGQFGNGTKVDARMPVSIAALTSIVQIGAGNSYFCAVRSTGKVVCAGTNLNGELGNGTTSTADTTSFVEVSGLNDAVEVAGGVSSSCARRSSGSVVCWGQGQTGRLGNGGFANSLVPSPVSGLSDAVQISVGDGHACARRAGGGIVCWGNQTDGALGSGAPIGIADSSANYATPQAVSGISNAVDVAAGFRHTCAALADGRAFCWGLNDQGQVGNGNRTNQGSPVQVSGLSGVTDVAAGDQHSCARRSDGTVRCWGINMINELGDGSSTNSLTPVTVLSQ
jgi:hypothetical protein